MTTFISRYKCFGTGWEKGSIKQGEVSKLAYDPSRGPRQVRPLCRTARPRRLQPFRAHVVVRVCQVARAGRCLLLLGLLYGQAAVRGDGRSAWCGAFLVRRCVLCTETLGLERVASVSELKCCMGVCHVDAWKKNP